MCLHQDEYNPLCDDCFAKLKHLPAGKEFTDDDMCDVCREFMKHYCNCCMSYNEDEIVEEGMCKECMEQWV